MKIISVLVLSLVLLSASCKKEPEICKWSDFTFDHPVSVYPVKESYSIGDTIWFEMNFSDVFDATVRNWSNDDTRIETLQLKNFDFRRTSLSIFKLQDSTAPVFAQEEMWDAFSSIHALGDVLSENKGGIYYKLLYLNGFYKLKIGVVCNETGSYLFFNVFSNHNPNIVGHLDIVDIRHECDVEHIEAIHFPINKQADGTYLTNYHLFEQYMNPALENNLDRIKKECFTFVVK